jgi:hypothetical protein
MIQVGSPNYWLRWPFQFSYSDGKILKTRANSRRRAKLDMCNHTYSTQLLPCTFVGSLGRETVTMGSTLATKQYILTPTRMLERIPISKWKVPMIAFAMTMIVAGYVRTSMHTARHNAQVERQRKLDEIAATRRAKVTQVTSKPS